MKWLSWFSMWPAQLFSVVLKGKSRHNKILEGLFGKKITKFKKLRSVLGAPQRDYKGAAFKG